jgi:hypothetical protein
MLLHCHHLGKVIRIRLGNSIVEFVSVANIE